MYSSITQVVSIPAKMIYIAYIYADCYESVGLIAQSQNWVAKIRYMVKRDSGCSALHPQGLEDCGHHCNRVHILVHTYLQVIASHTFYSFVLLRAYAFVLELAVDLVVDHLPTPKKCGNLPCISHCCTHSLASLAC